jgi:ParB family transcriptional regulator, chromosome partitioning protein
MTRKDTLKAMLSRREQELLPGNSTALDPDRVSEDGDTKKLQHIRSGAVGAMSRSLGNIASAVDQARALIASGEAVVELSPDRIDSSFISDRLPDTGEPFDQLMEAIRTTGQKSPILVRPHPVHPDRYQVAFGHRRVRVLAALGRPVKAVVQELTDEELVVIQGQENSARADLTHIERGLFAVSLEDRGFQRPVIMAALGIEKTQLSRLISLTRSLPRSLIEAIGPAPRAGRPRWIGLLEKYSASKRKADLNTLLKDGEFLALDTDARFLRVMAFLSAKSIKRRPETLKSEGGIKLAVVERSATKTQLVFEHTGSTPDFAEFVASQLARLHRTFLDRSKS